MKKCIWLLCLLVLTTSVVAAKKKTKEKNNSPAVVYSLPKTVLVVEVEITKLIQQPGPYFQYAEHYLALKDVVTENKTSYEVSAIAIKSKGIADPNKTFQVDKNASILLNNKGVICAINTSVTQDEQKTEEASTSFQKNKEDNAFILNTVLTEDQLVANSVAKMAENAAKQIYDIRESRIDLISGNNDKMPPDGESLKLMLHKLDEAEKALLSLFAGTTIKKISTHELEIFPERELNNEVLFRISALNGLVDKDDLSGSPVTVNLSISKNTVPSVQTDKKKGYFYLLPSIAKITISNNETEYIQKELEISQKGSLQEIPAKTINSNKLKVLYNSTTGSIRSLEN